MQVICANGIRPVGSYSGDVAAITSAGEGTTLMGHKTIQMTARYAHLAPQHRLAAVQRLCDTGAIQTKATDARTDTTGIRGVDAERASNSCRLISVEVA